MKTDWTQLEPFRVRCGPYATKPGEPFGQFQISPAHGQKLLIAATNGIDPELPRWEHVSVSAWKMNGTRPPSPLMPTWEQMAVVKDLFWEPEEAVMQLHPPHSEYVNQAKNCLHLWRPVDVEIPLPPSIMVGYKMPV